MKPIARKPIASDSNFDSLDIRVGRIVKVEDAETRKPTYKITVYFGPEIGEKISCGAFRRYTREELVGKLVIAVVNFEPMQMGPETSDVLILGARGAEDEAIYLTPESEVQLGTDVF